MAQLIDIKRKINSEIGRKLSDRYQKLREKVKISFLFPAQRISKMLKRKVLSNSFTDFNRRQLIKFSWLNSNYDTNFLTFIKENGVLVT